MNCFPSLGWYQEAAGPTAPQEGSIGGCLILKWTGGRLWDVEPDLPLFPVRAGGQELPPHPWWGQAWWSCCGCQGWQRAGCSGCCVLSLPSTRARGIYGSSLTPGSVPHSPVPRLFEKYPLTFGAQPGYLCAWELSTSAQLLETKRGFTCWCWYTTMIMTISPCFVQTVLRRW